MRNTKGKVVEEIVAKLNPVQRAIVDKLRSLILNALPDSVEKVKWGNIVYTASEKDVSWILIYESHVDIGFFRGAELNSKLLEGTGKGLRHIKIEDLETMPDLEIKKLLNEAAELEKSAK